jgi:hypothetical protein
MSDPRFPLDALDFLYMPSRDVAADLSFYTEVLGGRSCSPSRRSGPASLR